MSWNNITDLLLCVVSTVYRQNNFFSVVEYFTQISIQVPFFLFLQLPIPRGGDCENEGVKNNAISQKGKDFLEWQSGNCNQWDQKYEGDISNVNYRLVPELSSVGESSGDELGWSTVFVYQ